MLAHPMIKALSVLVYLLTVINLANVMVVQKDVVLTSLNDRVIISYSGSDPIYVLTSELSDAFIVDVISGSGGGQQSGSVHMRLAKQVANLTDTSFLVVLYSASPYVVNISRYSSDDVFVDLLRCPGNVSLQLVFKLINNLTGAYAPQPLQIPMYLRPPIWNVAVMAVLLAMFVSAAALDVRSYSLIKKDRWGVAESVALVVRYLLYGSLVAFVASALITMGLTAYNNLTYGTVTFEVSWLTTPFIVLVVNAVAYYICKWRGWYDVIDEE